VNSNFNSCVNDGQLDWASNVNNPQTGQSSSNEASPVDCQWGAYGEWSNCTKECGGGEKTRTRNEATPASNGGQECEGNSTETETCNQEECPSESTSCVELSQERMTNGRDTSGDSPDGELVIYSQTNKAITSTMTFVNGEMHGQEEYTAWGPSANAWKNAGLVDLNGDWTMRFDFEFPDGVTANEYFYIMFNRQPNKVKQDCDVCLAWGARWGTHTQFRHQFTGSMILPKDNLATAEILRQNNRPFSLLFTRKSDTGHITQKLYRRDTSELLIELEITKDVQFDDDKVPVSFYLNGGYANWNAVSVKDSTDIPSLTNSCTG